jgi:UDP-glucuronate decarboxylase
MNLGNPREFTIRQLADLVLKLTGSRSELVFCDLPPDDPKQRQPDIGLASSKINWTPTQQLETGLEKTIHYFRSIL